MLLKSLKLCNFRQFIGEQLVEFATDENQNVTIILGDNGTGKTTFAQAFSWCMYGDVDFADKRVLNKTVEMQMTPGASETVLVELSLVHTQTDYVLTRKQRYFADQAGRIKCDPPTFEMHYKTEQGQMEAVKPAALNGRRNEILSRELSRYFFFDGERIGNMSKEIQAGRSKEFGDAVRSLLGLSSIAKALEYLKPTRATSVYGHFEEQLKKGSNQKVGDLTRQIQNHDTQIETLTAQKEAAEQEIAQLDLRCEELAARIATLKESEELARRLSVLRSDLERKKQDLQSAYVDLFGDFCSRAHGYFSQPIVATVADELSHTGAIDRGVPNVTDKTIGFLMKRNRCICGAPIEVGNEAFQHLTELLNYIPPKSLGTSITEFVNYWRQGTKASAGYLESFRNKMRVIRGIEQDILRLTDDITHIERELEGIEKAGPLQRELQDKRNRKNTLLQKVNRLAGDIATHSSQRERLIHERDALAGQDQQNRVTARYMAYTKAIYDDLAMIYSRKEREIRARLQDTINEIFKRIYNGGISLSITERYAIQVTVSNEIGQDSGVETSTAQSISIIFAFIAGVIQMARSVKDADNSDGEDGMLTAEPYPLVMDAPLSAFDTRRIKNVCDVLPGIAEQVIIFIKDTDGNMAEEHMGQKVGARYTFEKHNEFETVVSRRTGNV